MNKLYNEEAALGDFRGVSCFVRTAKDGSKFEIELTNLSKEWLTSQTLVKHDGAVMTMGQRNCHYLHDKLNEFINSAMGKENEPEGH